MLVAPFRFQVLSTLTRHASFFDKLKKKRSFERFNLLLVRAGLFALFENAFNSQVGWAVEKLGDRFFFCHVRLCHVECDARRFQRFYSTSSNALDIFRVNFLRVFFN